MSVKASNSILIPFGKDFLVAGMLWQSLAADESGPEDLLQLAKTLNYSWYVSRKDWFLQAGFCNVKSKGGKRMFSLASLVHTGATRAGFPENWIGVFEINQGLYWIIAIAENAILPTSDVAGTEQEVLARLAQLEAMRDWQRVVLPQHLLRGQMNSLNVDLNGLLPNLKKREKLDASARMSQVDKRPKIVASAFLAACVLGLAGGVYAMVQQHTEAQKEAAASAAREAQSAAQRLAEDLKLKRREPKVLPPVWGSQPRVVDFIQACQSEFRAIPKAPARWELKNVSCATSGISANYERGTLGAPVDRAMRAMPGLGVGIDGERGSYGGRVDIPVAGDAETPMQYQDAARLFNANFQRLGLKVPLREVPLPGGHYPSIQAIPEDAKESPPIVQTWRTMAFTVDTTTPPPMLLAALDIPALRVKSIVLKDPKNAMYTIEGELYAN